MAVNRSNEAILARKNILENGVPDIDTVPIPDDIDIESYALSSIIIGEYWDNFREYIDNNPVPKIDFSDNFWEDFYKKYIEKSESFKKEIIEPKIQEILFRENPAYSLQEKALLRFFQINMERRRFGFPSIDDLYFFGILVYRMLIENFNDNEYSKVDVSKFFAYCMSLGRPQLNLLLVILYTKKPESISDISNYFDPNKFEIYDGVLRLKKEIRESFEKYLPTFESNLKQQGQNPRILKCPVIYSEKRIMGELFDYLKREIERQYSEN